jgi:hypothetical protein
MDIELPIGDPGEMRTRAARLAIECDRLRALAEGVDREAAVMDYRCPAGRHFRDEIRLRRADLEGITADLRGVRERILREAGRVEAEQMICAQLAHLAVP